MGYLHIDNLPKNPKVLMFKRGFCLEKVHGTSSHISFNIEDNHVVKPLEIKYFSGGEKYENFIKLFDEQKLKEAFLATGIQRNTTVYGEAYGGKQQGMKHVYGPELRFIAFDIKHGNHWLDVPSMDRLATKLGFEVVPWQEVELNLETLDALRDAPSEVSIRRGVNNSWREGIVIRPPIEVFFSEDQDNGGRIIAKHKRPEAQETKTPRNVGDKAKIFEDAEKAAEEYVVEMRLQHALDKLPEVKGIENVKELINYMVEDILREGAGEVVDSKPLRQAIGKFTVKLFKEYLNNKLRDTHE